MCAGLIIIDQAQLVWTCLLILIIKTSVRSMMMLFPPCLVARSERLLYITWPVQQPLRAREYVSRGTCHVTREQPSVRARSKPAHTWSWWSSSNLRAGSRASSYVMIKMLRTLQFFADDDDQNHEHTSSFWLMVIITISVLRALHQGLVTGIQQKGRTHTQIFITPRYKGTR